MDTNTAESGTQANQTKPKHTSYAADKPRIRNRLRRLEGQVRGVQRMVEEDQYCLDVLTQLSAIIAGPERPGSSSSRTTSAAASSTATRPTARPRSPS
jgi:hypothetical protein